jgi:hypothetical protein
MNGTSTSCWGQYLFSQFLRHPAFLPCGLGLMLLFSNCSLLRAACPEHHYPFAGKPPPVCFCSWWPLIIISDREFMSSSQHWGHHKICYMRLDYSAVHHLIIILYMPSKILLFLLQSTHGKVIQRNENHICELIDLKTKLSYPSNKTPPKSNIPDA